MTDPLGNYSATPPADHNRVITWTGTLEFGTQMGRIALPYVLAVPRWSPVKHGHHGAIVDSRLEQLLEDGLPFITDLRDVFQPPVAGWRARLTPDTGHVLSRSGLLVTDGVIVTPQIQAQVRELQDHIGVFFASRTDSRELAAAPPGYDTLPLLTAAIEAGNVLAGLVAVTWLNPGVSPTIGPERIPDTDRTTR